MTAPNQFNPFKKFSWEFSQIASKATEVYIAVGMITQSKFDFAIRQLKSIETIKIIVGVHMPTPPSMMDILYQKTLDHSLCAKIYTKKFFHPKLYLFNIAGEWLAFVGSGNFTNGGWVDNEELFVKISDEETIQNLKCQFSMWEGDAQAITEDFLGLYKSQFELNEGLEVQKQKNLKFLVDKLNGTLDFDTVNFTNQFFDKSDFMAFHPSKTMYDTPDILAERNRVRGKLYRLENLLSVQIPKNWNVESHYINEYVVSQIDTANHDEANVRSLWVGYGRDQAALKAYGDHNTTPLYFMRLQIIIHHESVGFWLMPGKAGAGHVDRKYFAEQMQNQNYKDHFFSLLTQLGDKYWIDIAGENRMVTSFSNAEELLDYTKKDKIHQYFTIGIDYKMGDKKLSINEIVKTCLTEFGKFQPIYEMIRHKF